MARQGQDMPVQLPPVSWSLVVVATGKLLLASVLHEAYAAVAAGWPAICQSRCTLWNGTALAILKQHSLCNIPAYTLKPQR